MDNNVWVLLLLGIVMYDLSISRSNKSSLNGWNSRVNNETIQNDKWSILIFVMIMWVSVYRHSKLQMKLNSMKTLFQLKNRHIKSQYMFEIKLISAQTRQFVRHLEKGRLHNLFPCYAMYPSSVYTNFDAYTFNVSKLTDISVFSDTPEFIYLITRIPCLCFSTLCVSL